MSSSLPINASLASALALHGGTNSNNGRNSSVASMTGGGSTNKKMSIHALKVHPSLPWVAYLAEEKQTTVVNSQRLVVQQYNRSQGPRHKTPHSSTTDPTILAALPMEKLPPHINRFRQSKSKSSKITNHPMTLATLGPLQSITFLDREALFWQTRRKYGAQTNLEIGGAAVVDQEEEELVLHADLDLNNVEGGMGRGLCLSLQFSRLLVILRFNKTVASCAKDSTDLFTVLCCLEGARESGKEAKIQYTPTSAAIPLTSSVVVYGCSDGAMRFHNLVPNMLYSPKMEPSLLSSPSSSSEAAKSTKHTRQSIIKSVRGPNGRNDPVVKIVNVDPAYNESKHSRGETPIETPTTVSDETTLVLSSRLLTVCSSGVAFLWDVRIVIDRSSGALRDLNVLPVSCSSGTGFG